MSKKRWKAGDKHEPASAEWAYSVSTNKEHLCLRCECGLLCAGDTWAGAGGAMDYHIANAEDTKSSPGAALVEERA